MPRISRPRIEPKFDCNQILAHPRGGGKQLARHSLPILQQNEAMDDKFTSSPSCRKRARIPGLST